MIEKIFNQQGEPRVWSDGSPILISFDEKGLIEWEKTVEANPWLTQYCKLRGFEVSREFERRLREARCHDCQAMPGEFHQPGCDVESCPFCGHQIISCDCAKDEDFYTELQQVGAIPWSGMWPGQKEAIEYDFWCRWALTITGHAWQRCAKGDHGARVNLNRVLEECVWDKVKRRWVRQAPSTETSENT
jgi:hypothetical protein